VKEDVSGEVYPGIQGRLSYSLLYCVLANASFQRPLNAVSDTFWLEYCINTLASCLIYARALLANPYCR